MTDTFRLDVEPSCVAGASLMESGRLPALDLGTCTPKPSSAVTATRVDRADQTVRAVERLEVRRADPLSAPVSDRLRRLVHPDLAGRDDAAGLRTGC
jgi:hypothetical protein